MNRKRTYLRLRSFLRANIPGLDQIYLGNRAIGFVLLTYFLLFPLLILRQWTLVWDGMASLVLSIFFLIQNPALHPILLRGEVIEHWTASLFVLAMPVLLWNLSRTKRSELIPYKDEHEMSQWNLAWREFRKNKIAAAGLIVILLMYTVAFLCPLLAPYQPNEFQDGVVTKFQPPLSSVTILFLKENRIPKMLPTALRNQTDYPREFDRLMRINEELTFSSFSRERAVDAFRVEGSNVLATVGRELVSIQISSLQGSKPSQFAGHRFYYLGTDSYGRDLLSRIIYGSRVSLSLGLVAVLLSVTLGTIIGLLAGYFGKYTDSILMRFVDILLAFPTLFLILIIIAAFEFIDVPRIFLIVVVLGLTSWMSISRLVRAEVLSIKERDFILAAKALGLGHMRILFRHVLPNTLTPIIVNATLRIGGIILVEAALSFLNIGVQQPTASWGNIIFEGKDFLANAWWLSTLPGIAIVLVVVCFNLLGDGLRDAFDPMVSNNRA